MPFIMIHGGDMNERIKQLSIEAGFPEWSNHAIEFELEKFAELIVRECVDVLNKRYMGDQNREDMEVRRCIDDVKKHFGVEE